MLLILKFGTLLRKAVYHGLTILCFLTFLQDELRMSLRSVDIEVLELLEDEVMVLIILILVLMVRVFLSEIVVLLSHYSHHFLEMIV